MKNDIGKGGFKNAEGEATSQAGQNVGELLKDEDVQQGIKEVGKTVWSWIKGKTESNGTPNSTKQAVADAMAKAIQSMEKEGRDISSAVAHLENFGYTYSNGRAIAGTSYAGSKTTKEPMKLQTKLFIGGGILAGVGIIALAIYKFKK